MYVAIKKLESAIASHVAYPINALTGRRAHAQFGSNDNCYIAVFPAISGKLNLFFPHYAFCLEGPIFHFMLA